MKLELLEKIKQEAAEENDFRNYIAMVIHLKYQSYLLEQINDEIAQRYSKEFAKQKLEEVKDILELPDHVLEGSPVISWSSAVKRAKEEIDKTIKEL